MGHVRSRPQSTNSCPDFDTNPRATNKIQPDASSNPFLSTGSSNAPKRPIFTLSFYAQYFDVDTAEVLKRCWASLFPRASFLDVLDGNPDLYGPFWIATTVVFILFLAGTMNWKLGGEEGVGRYDWGLLSGSAGLVYGYTGEWALVPGLGGN